MKARILILIACITLITAAAFAHGDEQHVIGTVASVAKDSITVKTANALVTVAVVPQTTFSKNKAAAKLADLNVGDRVVIHAKEPTEGKLVADTVQFSTPAAKPVPSAAK
jgi:ribosomal protein S1